MLTCSKDFKKVSFSTYVTRFYGKKWVKIKMAKLADYKTLKASYVKQCAMRALLPLMMYDEAWDCYNKSFKATDKMKNRYTLVVDVMCRDLKFRHEKVLLLNKAHSYIDIIRIMEDPDNALVTTDNFLLNLKVIEKTIGPEYTKRKLLVKGSYKEDYKDYN